MFSFGKLSRKTEKEKSPAHDPQKSTFEQRLAEYVQKHGATSPELIELADHFHGEQKAKKATEVTKNKQMTRRAALGVLGALSFGAAATALGVDAAKDAAKDAAEMRVKEIQEKFKEFQEKFIHAAFQLMDEMYKFIKLFKQPERLISAGEASVRGAIGDLTDYIMNRDKRPDNMQKSFEDMIKRDPELSASFEKINRLTKQLKKYSEEFGKFAKNSADWEYQRDKFMEDFFSKFIQHLLPGNE